LVRERSRVRFSLAAPFFQTFQCTLTKAAADTGSSTQDSAVKCTCVRGISGEPVHRVFRGGIWRDTTFLQPQSAFRLFQVMVRAFNLSMSARYRAKSTMRWRETWWETRVLSCAQNSCKHHLTVYAFEWSSMQRANFRPSSVKAYST
jgi:hypothetical protein